VENHAIVVVARRELEALADPAKAAPMAAYMKSDMPFYGVQKKGRSAVLRSLIRSCPAESRDVYESNVLALWSEPHREEKYLALGYARAWKVFITIESMSMYRDLIVEGAWWDLVDEAAVQLVGPVHLGEPSKSEPRVRSWIRSDNLWLRRTSIICQLKHKAATDTALLADACRWNLSDTDFFIRKAIGWALREYAKTAPEWVSAFVLSHKNEMAPLSLREATKHLPQSDEFTRAR
jgi:3-methyladenine DNA glycosylase AlkD